MPESAYKASACSESAYRAHIIELAKEAFGEEGADSWLHTRWRIFNNRTPLDLAESEREAGKVEAFITNLLGAEHMTKQAGLHQGAY